MPLISLWWLMISLVVIGNFGSVHFGEVEDDDLKRSSMVSEEKVSGLKAAASASIRSGVRSGAAASASRERNRKGKRRITEEIDEEENTLNISVFIKFYFAGQQYLVKKDFPF